MAEGDLPCKPRPGRQKKGPVRSSGIDAGPILEKAGSQARIAQAGGVGLRMVSHTRFPRFPGVVIIAVRYQTSQRPPGKRRAGRVTAMALPAQTRCIRRVSWLATAASQTISTIEAALKARKCSTPSALLHKRSCRSSTRSQPDSHPRRGPGVRRSGRQARPRQAMRAATDRTGVVRTVAITTNAADPATANRPRAKAAKAAENHRQP